MKQIDITNKNKDLDLRRFGKGVYSKAEKSGSSDGSGSGEGGSGGNPTEDSSWLDTAIEQIKAKNMFFDGAESPDEADGFDGTIYGNRETATKSLWFFNHNDDETIALLVSDEEWEVIKKHLVWNFDYALSPVRADIDEISGWRFEDILVSKSYPDLLYIGYVSVPSNRYSISKCQLIYPRTRNQIALSDSDIQFFDMELFCDPKNLQNTNSFNNGCYIKLSGPSVTCYFPIYYDDNRFGSGGGAA